jgi:very-short-patch-repair endonuclease
MKKKLIKLLELEDINDIKGEIRSIIKELDNPPKKTFRTKAFKKKITKVNSHSSTSNKFLLDKSKKFRKELLYNATKYEKDFRNILRRENIQHEFQKIVYYKESFYIADFYIKGKNIVVEIDGGYHNKSKQQKLDKIRTSDLKNIGVSSVIRIKNEDIYKLKELSKVLNKIK